MLTAERGNGLKFDNFIRLSCLCLRCVVRGIVGNFGRPGPPRIYYNKTHTNPVQTTINNRNTRTLANWRISIEMKAGGHVRQTHCCVISNLLLCNNNRTHTHTHRQTHTTPTHTAAGSYLSLLLGAAPEGENKTIHKAEKQKPRTVPVGGTRSSAQFLPNLFSPLLSLSLSLAPSRLHTHTCTAHAPGAPEQ